MAMGVSKTQVVKFIRKGDKGDKGEQGAVLRGPQAWSDCAMGYAFQAGGVGEKWQDVVIYGDNYYSCVKSHTKTASNYPGSPTAINNGYWQLGDKIELVATKILLATYALVKNLGVEAIDMKDVNGNILFQAKDGNVTCKTGTFENIRVSGNSKIAGFKIIGNGLVNEGFEDDAYVILRNDKYKCFAGIGGNVMPITSSLRSVARFENEDGNNHWGLGTLNGVNWNRNIAVLFSAKNGRYNHAFLGSGNGNLDGWIGGYRYSKYNLTSANIIYSGYSNLKDNNRWVIYSSVNNSGITLPKLSEVRDALGIGSSTNFCVDFTIIADLDSKDFYIYGRNGKKSSDSTYPWNTDEYPNLVNWDNDYWDSVTMGPGDSLTVLLIYDSAKSGNKGGYPLTYTARIINRQN